MRVNFFFCSVWLTFLPLDPDPDPGIQNLVDSTDPKHWYQHYLSRKITFPHYGIEKIIKTQETVTLSKKMPRVIHRRFFDRETNSVVLFSFLILNFQI